MPRPSSSRAIRTGSPGPSRRSAHWPRARASSSPEAQEASHLFFGDAVGHLLGMFATHPPLVERIRRIDPSFDGDFSKVRVGPPEPAPSELGGATTLRPQARPGRGVFGFNPAQMVSRIGTVDPRQLAYASSVLTSIPDPLKALAYEPFGARAVVFALLVDGDSERGASGAARTARRVCGTGAGREVEKILPMVHTPERPSCACPWSRWSSRP